MSFTQKMMRRLRSRRAAGVGRMGFKETSVKTLPVRSRRPPRKRRFGRITVGPTAVFPVLVPQMELKFHDVDLDETAIASAGDIQATINIIPQGTTEVQRVGRKCTIRQINWRFDMVFNATTAAASTSTTVRIVMYLDKQANQATAAVLDILETADYQSFNNLSNKKRFRTLMDRTYDFVAQAGGGDGTTEDYGEVLISDSFYKKVNIPIEFTSTTGAIGEITSNNIGVLLIGKDNNAVIFASKIRLRFTDL